MTFSFKKFSFAIVAGLVAAVGFVAPAEAAGSVSIITNPAPTFDSSSPSVTFTVGIDSGSGSGFSGSGTQLEVRIDGLSGSASGSWFPKSACTTTFVNVPSADCGITAVRLATGASGNLGTVQVAKSVTTSSVLEFKGLGDATAIEIEFANGAWTTAAGWGTYRLQANNSMFQQVGTASLNVNAPAPPSQKTVTFNANGGTGSMSSQSSSNPTMLTANAFTKSGTTFSGWSSSCSGPVVYVNRAVYTFAMTTTLYAVWADGSNACGGGGGGGNAASVNLTLNATTGQLVAGSTVAIVASGLQTSAPYSVVVQSTPQTLSPAGSTATAGAVNSTVTLPAGLEAGWHTLTFSSTAADGSAVSSVTYFKVSSDGTLLATASTIPAELASTGIDAKPYLYGGLALAIVGSALLLIARRKQTN